jgi:hypothetical protein
MADRVSLTEWEMQLRHSRRCRHRCRGANHDYNVPNRLSNAVSLRRPVADLAERFIWRHALSHRHRKDRNGVPLGAQHQPNLSNCVRPLGSRLRHARRPSVPGCRSPEAARKPGILPGFQHRFALTSKSGDSTSLTPVSRSPGGAHARSEADSTGGLERPDPGTASDFYQEFVEKISVLVAHNGPSVLIEHHAPFAAERVRLIARK